MAMILPYTLRQLAGEAPLIVAAQVSESSHDLATLDIEEVLKGEGCERVRVRIHQTECPPQPRYLPSSKVIAFLERSEDKGEWSTVGHAYGERQDQPQVRKRIRELLEIQKLRPSDQKRPLLDWLLRCSEDPATRHEALRELVEGPEDSPGRGDPFSRTFRPELTREDKIRLREAFLSETWGDLDLPLARVIDEVADGRVMRAYRKELSRASHRLPSHLGWLARRVAELSGRGDLEPLARDLSESLERAERSLKQYLDSWRT